MILDFNHLGTWLTTGYSYLFGTYAYEVIHPPGLSPGAVLNLRYPGQIEAEINPVEFDVIETSVIEMFEFAVQKSIRPPGSPEEVAARQKAVISDLKVAYDNARDVFEARFPDDSTMEWEFCYLFRGQEHSLIIRFECVWQ